MANDLGDSPSPAGGGPPFRQRMLMAFDASIEILRQEGDDERAGYVSAVRDEWVKQAVPVLTPYEQVVLAVDLLIEAEAGCKVTSAFALIPEKAGLGPSLYEEPPDEPWSDTAKDSGGALWTPHRMARWLCLLMLVPDNPDNTDGDQDALLTIDASELLVSPEASANRARGRRQFKAMLDRATAVLSSDKAEIPKTVELVEQTRRRFFDSADTPKPVAAQRGDTPAKKWVLTGLAGLIAAATLIRKLDGGLSLDDLVDEIEEDD